VQALNRLFYVERAADLSMLVYEGGQIPRIHGGGGAYRTCTLTFRAPCFHSDDDRVGRLVLIAARLRSAGRRDETPSELTRLFLITPKKSRSASLTKLVASDLALQRSTMYCSVRLGRVPIFVEFSCIRVLGLWLCGSYVWKYNL
jgi:hypothetical protein